MPKLLLPIAAVVAVGAATAGGATYLLTRGESVEEVPPAVQATATPAPGATDTPAEPTPTPTPAPESAATPDPTADWKTYTDATYGYSFDYPSSWFVHTDGAGGAIVSSWDTTRAKPIGAPLGDQLKFDIVVADNSEGLAVADWIVKYAMSSTDPAAVVSESPVVLDGKPGMRRETMTQDTNAQEYYFGVDSKIYLLTVFPLDSPLADTGLEIVASFTFSP